MASKRVREIAQAAVTAAAGYDAVPVPVEAIIRAQGIHIVAQPGGPDVAGMAYETNGRRVIGVNSAQSYRRQRFTLAHELYHVLKHPGRRIVDGRVVFGHRDKRRALSHDEIDANLFASLLLMPSKTLDADVDEIGQMTFEAGVRHLASKYEVSEQAMLIRLYDYIDYLLPHK